MPFVSIEGIDGSGKSTQVAKLVSALRGQGLRVVQTKEPDGGHIGQEVRACLVKEDRSLSRAEELLLVSAARYDHVRRLIRPTLLAGDWVVSDRYLDSTFAVQVYGDSALLDLFRSASKVVVEETLPDFTFILDLPVSDARARRLDQRNSAPDPAEATRDFERIRSGFLEAVRLCPQRCYVLNAQKNIDELSAEIWATIKDSISN